MDGTQALNRAWQDPKLFVPKNYLPKTGQRRCNCGNGCVYVCVWPVPWRLKRWLAASVKFTTAAAMHATLFVLRYLFVVFCCRGCIFLRLNIPLPNGSILFVCLFACLAATFFLDLSHPSPSHPAGPLAIRVILWHLVPARRTLVGTIDSANQKKTPARCIWGKINTKFMKHLICEKNLLIPGHHYLLDWNPVVIFTIMRVCDCSFQGV